MLDTTPVFRRIFDEDANHAFLAEIPGAMFKWYEDAAKLVKKGLTRASFRDAYGHVRRGYVEDGLMELAIKHGVDCVRQSNVNQTSSHIMLKMGRVILTASAVDGPTDLVMLADFRQTYARSNQMTFLPEEEVLEFREGIDYIYAILLHGPMVNDPTTPRFAMIQFPNSDCSDYLGFYENLFYRHMDKLKSIMTVDRIRRIEQAESRMQTKPKIRLRPSEEEAGNETGG